MSWKNFSVEILKNSNGMNTTLREPVSQNLIAVKCNELLVARFLFNKFVSICMPHVNVFHLCSRLTCGKCPLFLWWVCGNSLSAESDRHSFQHVVKNVDVCDIIQTVVPTVAFQLKFITKCNGMQILKKNTGEYEQLELSEQQWYHERSELWWRG